MFKQVFGANKYENKESRGREWVSMQKKQNSYLTW